MVQSRLCRDAAKCVRFQSFHSNSPKQTENEAIYLCVVDVAAIADVIVFSDEIVKFYFIWK